MYNKLNWLTVNQLIAYHTLIAVYRVRQSREPEYLAVSMCRDNKQGNIVMKKSLHCTGTALSSGAQSCGTNCQVH